MIFSIFFITCILYEDYFLWRRKNVFVLFNGILINRVFGDYKECFICFIVDRVFIFLLNNKEIYFDKEINKVAYIRYIYFLSLSDKINNECYFFV